MTTGTTAGNADTQDIPKIADHPDLAGGDIWARGHADRWMWEARYVKLLLIIDFGATLLATLAAFVLRFQGAAYANWYLALSALIPPVWVGLLALTHAYERRVLFVGGEEYQRVLRAGVRLTVGMALASYVAKADLARGYLLLVLVLTTALSLAGRFALRKVLHRARRRGACMHRVLVLGHAPAVAQLTSQLHRRYHHGLQVIGACLPADQLAGAARTVDVPVFGALGAAANSAAAAGADTVMVLSCPELDGPMLRRLAWELERDDIDLIVSSSLVDTAGDRITVRPVDGLPMMHIEHPRLSGGRRLIKSVFDVSVAALLLVLLAPVFAAIAVIIKLDSGGPVFFRQVRVARGGEMFRMYKFRTMHADAEARLAAMREQNEFSEVLFKIRDDPRVTRSGRFLRRYSLDELPQLLNVLLGEMSLVGPRPPLPDEVEQYPQDMRRRLVVRPGMTGLWQVSGRSDLSWEDSVRLDLRYVENWSLTMDLVILMRTAMVVMRGAGAY
ncbi:exopolysaccharide biosynthesis polyprenyl glycosylphosphotransferase [Actinoplanes sp. NBRC 14428]|uniref:Undecaprenyl-phosphate galactose phosphotransferase WbaP/exopolysaccharide biosynthesis polyprenyl glycosylphosphotransferase n=1 Tax=Pseudosporangium ferrugineum TaxID=439699 RepID=A0A2T0RNW7_9ACTN|nr:sugar transferase [Pseudosporangium ferrugineum]PRY22827.1 Undecaprenyl-phosphate galactose phosphotransferase WbaP/exopolysaccharide biosynthesis polyprenyl glycosylphosphotransferase [Pseudosporangium ferrugineum]BCJ55166.1 exopolysaccharide biosynthesis polyprenyl glycosylphosphotransferase [Actinoplanes sp. NBRC 14428]